MVLVSKEHGGWLGGGESEIEVSVSGTLTKAQDQDSS